MLNDSLIRTFIHSFTRFLTTISDNLIINFCQFEDYIENKNTPFKRAINTNKNQGDILLFEQKNIACYISAQQQK